MIPRLYSVTIGANDTTVTVNSPSLDFTGAVQHGWQIMIDGHSLPITIVSGGPGTLEIDPADTPSTALTARAAKVIETKGLMQIAADGLENARQELVTIKNSAKTTPDNDSIAKRLNDGRLKAKQGTANDDVINKGQTGTAAFKDVVESATDIVTGRILNVGAGGLLNSGNAPSILPDNTLYPSMLGRDGDGAGGYPVFGWASTILNMRYNATRQSQIGVSHSSGVANIAFRTMVSDNLWTDVYNLFGEHNSKNPLEQGLGSDNLYGDNLTTDLQDTGVNGNTGFFAYGPSCLDIPVASSYGMVMNLNYQTGTNAGAQLVLVTSPNNRMLFRSGGIDTAPWSEVYHSNNLNPNSFGLAANDLVGKGSAASATVAVFELPLVSTKAPTSLTVTGTFKIKNPASGSDLITGISAATIANALNSSSSDRWAYIVLSGLAGLTFNHALHLVGETADANIKVNF